jgi:hypothetical protein
MKTYNELERAKRDKIRQLSVDEAERYINKLNKEMAEAWGNLNNSFSIDAKTMMKNSALCDEAVDILNDKYKMELLVATSRLNALVEKHESDIEDVRKLILETSLHGLMSSYWQTSHNILILTQFLNILYENYWITPAIMEDIIDMGNATEENKAAVIEEVDMAKIPVYSMYHQHFMNTLELNIKHMASIIDEEIVILKRLIKFQFKEDAADTGTYYDDFIKGMIEYQKLSQELIADYEELKLDGFKNAKTIEAETMAEVLDKDVDFFNDLFKKSRPSYDVNNFIFIPPKVHIESMAKYHPDWKSKYPASDDDYDDEGVDSFYAEVTNPIL